MSTWLGIERALTSVDDDATSVTNTVATENFMIIMRNGGMYAICEERECVVVRMAEKIEYKRRRQGYLYSVMGEVGVTRRAYN